MFSAPRGLGILSFVFFVRVWPQRVWSAEERSDTYSRDCIRLIYVPYKETEVFDLRRGAAAWTSP